MLGLFRSVAFVLAFAATFIRTVVVMSIASATTGRKE
jgi:hypothetical protein